MKNHKNKSLILKQHCCLHIIILEAFWVSVTNCLLLCCSLEKSMKQAEIPWTGPLEEKKKSFSIFWSGFLGLPSLFGTSFSDPYGLGCCQTAFFPQNFNKLWVLDRRVVQFPKRDFTTGFQNTYNIEISLWMNPAIFLLGFLTNTRNSVLHLALV